MRGADRQTSAMFSYLSRTSGPATRPLRIIRLLVNAALERLSDDFDEIYSRFGRRLNIEGAPALQRLPEIAAGMQVAVTQAGRVLGSINNGYGEDSSFQRQIARLMAQMNETAQSFRTLSDLLTCHPEALIRGRSKTELEYRAFHDPRY